MTTHTYVYCLHPVVVAEVVIEHVTAMSRCHVPAGQAEQIQHQPAMLNAVGVRATVVLKEVRSEDLLAVLLMAGNMRRADRILDVGYRECRGALLQDIVVLQVDVPVARDVVANPDRYNNIDQCRVEHIVHVCKPSEHERETNRACKQIHPRLAFVESLHPLLAPQLMPRAHTAHDT
jgi:hypothetical protein